MSYGFCYDSARKCSGKAQPGTRILRDTMDDLVPDLGDFGIYNCRPTRGGGSLSVHGEGRAWDCAIPSGMVTLGNTAAQFFVDAAQDLGIQRVIWGFGSGKAAKEWDSREGQRYWSAYSGPLHDDHCHVEQCWQAALHLTVQQVKDAFVKYWPQEDDMAQVPQAEWNTVKLDVAACKEALFKKKGGVTIEHLNRIDAMLTALGARMTPPLTFNDNGTAAP